MGAFTGTVKTQPHKGKPAPRELLTEPGKFARSVKADVNGEYWGLGARTQNRTCWQVRTFMKEHGIDLLDLALMTNHTYQRLSRVLNGSVWMSMEDLGRLQAGLPEAFGLKSERTSRYPSPTELRRRQDFWRGHLEPVPVVPGGDVLPCLEWPPEAP